MAVKRHTAFGTSRDLALAACTTVHTLELCQTVACMSLNHARGSLRVCIRILSQMRGKAVSSTNAALLASDPRAGLQHASKQPSIMSTSSEIAHCRSPPVGGGGCDGIPVQVRP